MLNCHSTANFDAEVNYILEKFRKADYLLRFINNIVNDSIKSMNNLGDSYILLYSIYSKNKNFHLD